MADHEHSHHPGGYDQQKAGQLTFAIALTALVFVGEVLGGIWSGSLALLSDAGHVFSDLSSLALSLVALKLACRPPTYRHTYGLHRAEVLAALVNGLALLVICVVIFREATLRLLQPTEVRSTQMLLVAVLGLVANGVVALRLGHHGQHDINIRSAYLHVVGDLLASVAVVVGALIIRFTGLLVVDPILSAGIGLLILAGAARVTREALHILLEGVPAGIDLQQVAAAIAEIPKVEGVHHVHAWTICSNVLSFSAHVVACPETEQERVELRRQIQQVLSEGFGFADTTIELECTPPKDTGLLRPIDHDSREPRHEGHWH